MRDIPEAAKRLYEKIASLEDNGVISNKLSYKMEAWVAELVERVEELECLYADERIARGR